MLVVHLIGKVKTPLEEKVTSSGKKYLKMGIAVETHRKGKKESLFVYGYLWDNRFDKMVPFIQKESLIYLVGTLDVQSYLSKEGEAKSVLGVNINLIHFVPKPSLHKEEFEGIYREEDKKEDPLSIPFPSTEWNENLF